MAVGFLLVVPPAESRAKAPREVCPDALRALKDPLPATAELYRERLRDLIGRYRLPLAEGTDKIEAFCQDARARAIDRLLAGAPSEVLDRTDLQILVGEFHFTNGKLEAARDAFFRVHRAERENLWAALRLAEIAGRSSQPEARRSYLEIALARKSEDTRVVEMQREALPAYAALMPRSKAEKFIRDQWAKNFPSDHQRGLALIKIAEAARDPKLMKEGVDVLGRLAPDSRASSEVYFYRGLGYHMQKDYPRAFADLQSFLEHEPRVPTREQDALKLLIDSAQKVNDKRAVKKWLEWGFEKDWLKDARHLAIHENSVLLEDHEGLEGLEALKKAHAWHPKSLRLQVLAAYRALSLAEAKTVEWRRAASLVDHLEMDFPESLEASYFRGRYLRGSQKFSQAQSYFERVRDEYLTPKTFNAGWMAGEFFRVGAENLLSLGRFEAARLWVEWALKQRDLSKEHRDNLELMKSRMEKNTEKFSPTSKVRR